jgi:hypothetical protein
VALAEADQFAVIWEQAAPEPALAVGTAGVAGKVAYVIVPELALVPQLFFARTR